MVHETNQRSTSNERPNPPAERLFGWGTRQGRRVRNALVYSSAYLALIAMAQVVTAMVLLSLPMNAAPLVVGLITFAVYANDRVADADTDEVSNPDQAAFARRHGRLLYILASVSYGLAVAISVLGGPVALALALLPGVFWVLYASDWIPHVAPQIGRLKDVFLLNSLVVASAWALTLTLLPLAFADAAPSPAAAVVFAYFLLGTFANTEIPNVRDMEGDRAIGVSTLPVVVGVTRTRQALYGVDAVLVLVLGYAAASGVLSDVLVTALVGGLCYSVVVTACVGRVGRNELLTLAAECEYLIVGVGIVAIAWL